MLHTPLIENKSLDQLQARARRANKTASTKTLQINALSLACATRVASERFIQKGYLKAYQAHINVTTPYLISLQHGSLKSALGVRSAKQALFTEQYIDASIEQAIAEFGLTAKRSEIAEIAHLYSNAKVFTVPLLLVTALALKYKGFSTMVFTGTAHVINLISKTGIKVHALAKANPAMLKQSNDNWGTYYESKPEVAFIELNNVLQIIESSPQFSMMFEQLSGQVANVVSQLEAL